MAIAARPGIRVRWPQSGSARCPRRGGRSPSLTSSIPQVTLRFAAAGLPHRTSGRGGPLPAAPRFRRGPRWRLQNSEPFSSSAEAAGRACALGAARRSARLGAAAGAALRMRGGDSGLGGCGAGGTGSGSGFGERLRPGDPGAARPSTAALPAPSRRPCSPLAMCGALGFEARVPPPACSSPLPPQQRAGAGVTSLLAVLPCRRTPGVLVAPPGATMCPGWPCPLGGLGCQGSWVAVLGEGVAGCPCPSWIWCFFWERFGQSALREMPRGLQAQGVCGSALGKVGLCPGSVEEPWVPECRMCCSSWDRYDPQRSCTPAARPRWNEFLTCKSKCVCV